jgi:hypothetical protein
MQSQSKPRLLYLEDAATALSLASLIFIGSWYGNLYNASFGYYSKQPLTATILLAMLCNLLGFAALFWLGAQVLRRHRKWPLDVAAALCIFLPLLPPVEFFRVSYFGITDRMVLSFIRGSFGLGIMALTLGAVLWRPRRVIRTVGALMLILSPMAFYVLARTLLLLVPLLFAATQGSRVAPSLPPLYPRSQPVRVVWIIFDELDQRLAFDQRPASLALPELDRLVSESLAATNAYPPGGCTLLSIPGLLAGQVFHSAEPSHSDDLRLTVSPTNPPVQFSQLTNVFDEVRNQGGNTAVVGWYHPYARLVRRSLNFAVWNEYAALQVRDHNTFWGALGDQWGNSMRAIRSRYWHVEHAEKAIRDSLTAATNSAYALTLLHFPFPHGPTIYDPAQQRLLVSLRSFPKGYFDNLQLTDRVLGQVRVAMEQAGQWDKTWVLVSSDHCWRKAAAHDGRTDYRVPFILKPPGPAAAKLYEPLLNTVVTKELILAILRGQVRDLPAATTWLQAQTWSNPDYTGSHAGE